MLDLSSFDNLSDIEFTNISGITSEYTDDELNNISIGGYTTPKLIRGSIFAYLIDNIFRIKSNIIEFVSESTIIKCKSIKYATEIYTINDIDILTFINDTNVAIAALKASHEEAVNDSTTS